MERLKDSKALQKDINVPSAAQGLNVVTRKLPPKARAVVRPRHGSFVVDIQTLLLNLVILVFLALRVFLHFFCWYLIF